MSSVKASVEEVVLINKLISPYIKPRLIKINSDRSEPVSYDKRMNMYGGDGSVYLVQMFGEGELVNNRIGAYMILPGKGDSVGMHTHGTRKEEELYVVLRGTGIYYEQLESESDTKSYSINPGSVTAINGDGLHGVKNTGSEPLIIFVITTNEP